MTIERNDEISIYANQGDRDATVLAISDGRALLEYVMPAGRTFLRVVKLDEQGNIVDGDTSYRAISYAATPARFIRDMVEHGVVWIGGFDEHADLSERALRHGARELERAKVQRARLEAPKAGATAFDAVRAAMGGDYHERFSNES